jgi:hypothetical protein
MRTAPISTVCRSSRSGSTERKAASRCSTSPGRATGRRTRPAPCRPSATNDIGAATLQAVWRDPQFDPAQSAVYYARAIEIPTPRWTTYLAVRNDLPLPEGLPATLQERAWTSPIFYTPG